MSDAILSLLAQASLKGSVVCLAALIAAAFLRTAAPATRHLVMLAALASFLVIPLDGLILPGLAVRSPLPTAHTVLPPAQAPVVPASSSAMTSSLPEAPDASAPLDVGPLLLAAWAAGVLLLLARMVIAFIAMRGLLSSARPLGRLAPSLPRRPRLLQDERCTVPMTVGTLRPVIILPVGLAAETGAAFDAVIAHEIAHVRRCDALSGGIAYLVCSLFWFVPFAWVALSRLRVEQEKACDDDAMLVFPDRAGYAELLVRLSAAARRPVFFAAHAAAARTLEERVRGIIGPRRTRAKPRRIVRSLLAVGSLAVLAPLSMMRCAPASAPAARNPAPVQEARFQLRWKTGALILAADHTPTTYDYPVVWPLGSAATGPRRGTISGVLGPLPDPETGKMVENGGIDVRGTAGWSVLASGSGVVASTGYNSDYGNYVIIAHPDGFRSIYGLLQGIPTFSRGAPVSAGQGIGIMGGVLRFAVSLNGQGVDPQEILAATLEVIGVEHGSVDLNRTTTTTTTEEVWPPSPRWPLKGNVGDITLPFGPQINPFTKVAFFHQGIDIAWSPGTPIIAAHSGAVTETGSTEDLGNYLRISDGSHVSTLYAHMDTVTAHRGDRVEAGQQIGTLGSTGLSTGPHLHFEVAYDGVPVDPSKLLAQTK